MADKEELMEKHIMGENGISYTLGADGLYYPDLTLPKGTEYTIGRYGRMRAGITEQLKAIDQMKWVGLMNNVRNVAEKIIKEEIIHQW